MRREMMRREMRREMRRDEESMRRAPGLDR
jgi:hypothetical protein